VEAGLLYYSKTSVLHRVRRAQPEVRSLLIARNEIANYLARSAAAGKVKIEAPDQPFVAPQEKNILPEPIDEARRCARCFANAGCSLYREAHGLDRPEADNVEMQELIEKQVGHLKDEHFAFFRRWDKLVTLEEGDVVKHRRELWTLSAKQRESKGKCFSDMTLLPDSTGLVDFGARRVNRYAYSFGKALSTPDSGSLLSGHMGVNDPITISLEPAMYSLAQGFITELTPDRLTIGLDHSLDAALERAHEEGIANHSSRTLFRIDKDELTAGYGKIRMNVAQLFISSSELDQRRRSLIVDLVKPKFQPPAALPDLPENLNDDQRNAIGKVLAADDYACILGMPGTGKTTMIAELVKLLVLQGKTVLLTSYTHSAVDTIMRKLLDAPETKLLRLGNASKAHQDLKAFTSEVLNSASTVAALEMSLMGANVIGTTCLSLGHVIFSRRRFDYCIVDEASQITLPTCLGPLRFADRFVLVGDHFQLPPLVRNPIARDGGLEVSLFKRLSEAHPDSVASLTAQYRMNADIMAISNKLVYSGRLRCGNEEVANLSLRLPEFGKAMEHLHSDPANSCTGDASCWLAQVLDPARKALLIDTDATTAMESRTGDLVENPGEAKIISEIVHAMVSSGVSPHDIAVITPYRQQIKLLTHTLLRRGHPDVEILTADKSQGRDKAVVLVSLVRANPDKTVGRLLGDWRRINVAFTRAQRKLLVVCSQSTLGGVPIFRDFFELMQERKWIFALPPGAEKSHVDAGESSGRVQRKLKLA
jgi:DNA replication ATP-dependent helicase Dna2